MSAVWDLLGSLFVEKPVSILLVAAVWAGLWAFARHAGTGSVHRPGALLVPAVAWGLYAVWEWLVVSRTPDANIRVDLLLIWPVLLLLSVVFSIRALR